MPLPKDEFRVRLQDEEQAAQFQPAAPPAAMRLLRERRLSLALRSAAALIFGIAFLWPSMTGPVLVRLFAAYAFVDGVLAVSPGGWGLAYRRTWPLLIGGCISIASAAAAYAWPGITLPLLGDLTAVWAIAVGAAFLLAYGTLREAGADHLWFLCAIAAMLFGRALLSQLAGDVVIFSTWLALYTLTIGVLFLKLTLQHYELLLD